MPPNTTLAMPPPPSLARLLLAGTSLSGFAALGYGLAVAPLPIGGLAAGLGAHAVVCTLGVLLPGLSVFGSALCRAPAGHRAVALTFDDGPDPTTTPRVLALLAATGARATFFVLGEKAERHPDVVRELSAAGHEIGLHGHSHDRLYALRSSWRVGRDIRRGLAALERLGVRPTLFRPPVGLVSHGVALAAEREGLRLAAWSRRGLDGRRGADADAVLRRVSVGLEDGAVLLLHDAAERGDHEPVSLRMLPALLEELERRGLRPVTMSELFAPPRGLP